MCRLLAARRSNDNTQAPWAAPRIFRTIGQVGSNGRAGDHLSNKGHLTPNQEAGRPLSPLMYRLGYNRNALRSQLSTSRAGR